MHYFFIMLGDGIMARTDMHIVLSRMTFSLRGLHFMLATSLEGIQRGYGYSLSAQVSPGGVGAADCICKYKRYHVHR